MDPIAAEARPCRRDQQLNNRGIATPLPQEHEDGQHEFWECGGGMEGPGGPEMKRSKLRSSPLLKNLEILND